MNDSEFIELEYRFLDDLKSSDIYKEMKRLSKLIDEDDELRRLGEERDEFLTLADKEKDPEKKKELLLSFNQKDKEIRENALMKEYLFYYEKVRRILIHLSDGLNKELI